VWQRSVHTGLRKTARAEEHSRTQAETIDPTRFIAAAHIVSSKPNEIPVGRNIAVATEKSIEAFPEIGNYHDIGLVISGARFDPCLPLAHLVGRAQVCVPVRPSDLQTAEFMDQKEIDHASDRVGAVHGRGAILEDVNVIDHGKGDQVDVRACASSGGAQRTIRDTFAID
jgi:hypothetical protein